MQIDHSKYYYFTTKSRLDKAVNSLLGILEGITADLKINEIECGFLVDWLEENQEYVVHHPFNELIPVVSEALSDGVLTNEERSDIIWLCEKLKSPNYYDIITADMQRLHALLGAIACDGEINESELNGLSAWLNEHEHLRRCWPYDEIDSLVTAVMSDKKISERENLVLQAFFSEFVIGDNRTLVQPLRQEAVMVYALCAACPEIIFKESLFCFTGASIKYSRKQFHEIINNLGGNVANSVTPKLDYLVIGAEGNPCWAYACYGRKVEKAVELRKQGNKLLLIHEHDFHDAVLDNMSG